MTPLNIEISHLLLKSFLFASARLGVEPTRKARSCDGFLQIWNPWMSPTHCSSLCWEMLSYLKRGECLKNRGREGLLPYLPSGHISFVILMANIHFFSTEFLLSKLYRHFKTLYMSMSVLSVHIISTAEQCS